MHDTNEMEDSLISNEMTRRDSMSQQVPECQREIFIPQPSPITYVKVGSQWNREKGHHTLIYERQDDDSSTSEDNQEETFTSHTEQLSHKHDTLVTENTSALITEKGATAPNAEIGALGSTFLPVAAKERLKTANSFPLGSGFLSDLRLNNNNNQTAFGNSDWKKDDEPQDKIPRLELHASRNAFTPSGLPEDYMGQSSFESSSLSLNLQGVVPSNMAMHLDEPSDNVSPTVSPNTTTANTTDCDETNQMNDKFNGDNSSASIIPTEPHQLLQKYLLDTERFQKLRNYLAHDMVVYSAENRQWSGHSEVLEELINVFKHGDQNDIYQLLARSLMGLTTREDAMPVNAINDEHHSEENGIIYFPTMCKYSVDSDTMQDLMDIIREDLPLQDLGDIDIEAHIEPNRQQHVRTFNNEVPHSSSQSSAITNAHQTHTLKMDGLYNKLEEVVERARSELSHKELTEHRKITVYGKLALRVMFDLKNESYSGRTVNGVKIGKFDDDKVCAIAKFLAWLISNEKPEEISMDKLKTFVANLPAEKKSGLEDGNYEYFKKNVLHNCANRLRHKD